MRSTRCLRARGAMERKEVKSNLQAVVPSLRENRKVREERRRSNNSLKAISCFVTGGEIDLC